MWATAIGVIGALVVGVCLMRYGWLCISRKEWVHEEAFRFWNSERGWKIVSVAGIMMMVFFVVAGFASLLLGDWQGAMSCAICIVFGLLGLAFRRISRSFNESFYKDMSKTPALPGVYYLLLGLFLILIILWEFLKKG